MEDTSQWHTGPVRSQEAVVAADSVDRVRLPKVEVVGNVRVQAEADTGHAGREVEAEVDAVVYGM